MYIVTIDNPHYPQVIYCVELEDARKEAEILIEENHEDDGDYSCRVIIAKVHTENNIKTYY